MLVSFGNARRREHGIGAGAQLAIAARDAAFGRVRDNSPSRARAQGTNFGDCFHGFCSYSALNPASAATRIRASPVYILWSHSDDCGERRKTDPFSFGCWSAICGDGSAVPSKPGVWHGVAIDNPPLGEKMAPRSQNQILGFPGVWRGNRNTLVRREHEQS